jgi:hypothetical protein
VIGVGFGFGFEVGFGFGLLLGCLLAGLLSSKDGIVVGRLYDFVRNLFSWVLD